MKSVISITGNHPTLRFAAQELARYLKLGTGVTVIVERRSQVIEKAFVYRLGLATDLGVRLPVDLEAHDDWIYLNSKDESCILSGSNPRSVLFAVYRYLREQGFCWIRPGIRGEIIPKLKQGVKTNLQIRERPSYRYRTFCIEGACSFEHVRDLIDWSAKQGMNGYFLQFDLGTCFWNRWYAHKENPYWQDESPDERRVQEIVTRVIQEIRKRDLRFERVGHGWTCAALGLPGEGWDANKIRISPGKKQWLAELNCKRELYYGVPINTNLCYSNPDVRTSMNNAVLDYAKAHPEVEAIHLWLADGSNNNCECPDCHKLRPSDYYVQMLNELDEKLTFAKLPTKIVFLLYVDLLWPPQCYRIKNQDRFILMFAPITRVYNQSYLDDTTAPEVTTPFIRNRLVFPKSASGNLAYLGQWQKLFRGDGFIFDYHMIWALFFDPNQIELARVLHSDIQSLASFDLKGFNSCQVQRASFPHNLLMDVLAKTLWNKKQSFAQISRTTFTNAYGNEGAIVLRFFDGLSKLWRPFFYSVFTPERDSKRIAQSLRNLKKMKDQTDSFRLTVKKQGSCHEGAMGWSWRYLARYLDLMDLLLPAFEAYLNHATDCQSKFEKVFDFLWKHEKELHPALDVMMMISVLKWRVAELENTSPGH